MPSVPRNRQFFIERALRRKSAKKAAETRKTRKAQRDMLAAAGWSKTEPEFKLAAESDLNDSIDDLFR